MKRFNFSLYLLLFATPVFAQAQTPQPPLADAGPDKIVLGEAVCLLQGEASDADTDTKKLPLALNWSQLQGPAPARLLKPTEARCALADLQTGEYVFRLSVTDGQQLVSTDEVTITVRPAPPAGLEIKADDPLLRYSGRTFLADKGKVRELGFSGASVHARFSGTSLRAKLKAGWGPPPIFWAILDGDTKTARVLHADNRTDLLVAEDLDPGEHSLELVRLSGAWSGAGEFRGLVLDRDAKLLPSPPAPSRRIEFYGDSITEGTYWPQAPGVNPYFAYAMTTARLLDAEAHLVAKSGMGLVRGYTLPQTLSAFVERSAPMRSKPEEAWDFSTWTPHVVVVNIGQNDAWTWGKKATTDWNEAYIALLKTLRQKYPQVYLVASLGSMDIVKAGSEWPARRNEAVAAYQQQTGDTRITTFDFPYLAQKGHPSPEEAGEMARLLSEFLEKLPGALPPQN